MQNGKTQAPRSHEEFNDMVSEMLQEICPDVCSFDDIPDFSREFAALCEKYRASAGHYR